MPYYVVHPNGSKYGPADLNILQKWVDEGRLNEQSMLEDSETGRAMPASLVSGLRFGPAAQAASPYQTPPAGPYQQTPPTGPYQQTPSAGPYRENPANPYQFSTPPSYDRRQKVDNHLVKAIFATVCCCVPFGVVAIVYAAQVDSAAARGDMATAYENAEKADTWSNWSIGLGLAGSILYGIVGALSAFH